MTHLRQLAAFIAFAMLVGIHPDALSVAKRASFGTVVSNIGCTAGTQTFHYDAAWSDTASAGSYNFKMGNQCVLVSPDGKTSQQCTTNSAKSCTAKCISGKCKASFSGCLRAGAGAMTLVAGNGSAYEEVRYAAPICN